jgi:hypothetical protein
MNSFTNETLKQAVSDQQNIKFNNLRTWLVAIESRYFNRTSNYDNFNKDIDKLVDDYREAYKNKLIDNKLFNLLETLTEDTIYHVNADR